MLTFLVTLIPILLIILVLENNHLATTHQQLRHTKQRLQQVTQQLKQMEDRYVSASHKIVQMEEAIDRVIELTPVSQSELDQIEQQLIRNSVDILRQSQSN